MSNTTDPPLRCDICGRGPDPSWRPIGLYKPGERCGHPTMSTPPADDPLQSCCGRLEYGDPRPVSFPQSDSNHPSAEQHIAVASLLKLEHLKAEHEKERRKLWAESAVAYIRAGNSSSPDNAKVWADFTLGAFDKRFPAPSGGGGK